MNFSQLLSSPDQAAWCRRSRWCKVWPALVALLLGLGMASAARASCTVGGSEFVELGQISSLAVTESYQSGFAAGLSCNGTIVSVAVTNYVKVRLEATGKLIGLAHGQEIPISIKAQRSGAALSDGEEFVFTNSSVLGFFSTVNASVPMYIDVPMQEGLRADIYQAAVTLRWYYSICTGMVSIGGCQFTGKQESPNFKRGFWGGLTSWGTGTPVTLFLRLVLEKDCAIHAPDLAFGRAPLVTAFRPVNQSILINCSAGEPYSVGLSDGSHPDGSSRRMRSAAGDDLRYQLYKGNSGSERWGHLGQERRASATAERNAGRYDGKTQQSFSYRGVIDPQQATPPAGIYSDHIVVDVAF